MIGRAVTDLLLHSIRPQPINVLAVPCDVFHNESPGLRDVLDEVKGAAAGGQGFEEERVRPARFHPRPSRERGEADGVNEFGLGAGGSTAQLDARPNPHPAAPPRAHVDGDLPFVFVVLTLLRPNRGRDDVIVHERGLCQGKHGVKAFHAAVVLEATHDARIWATRAFSTSRMRAHSSKSSAASASVKN